MYKSKEVNRQLQVDHGDLSYDDPVPGGIKLFEWIRDHDIGIIGVIIELDDVYAAKAAAEEMGAEFPLGIDMTEEQLKFLKLDNMYTKYIEYFVWPTSADNTTTIFSHYEYK